VTVLVKIQDVQRHFRLGFSAQAPVLRALDGVSLEIEKGESLGLVGESGSGKSTLGRCLVGLQTPTAGRIYFDDIATEMATREQQRSLRRRRQLIFQDPHSALNSRMTVGETLGEHLKVQGFGPPARIRAQVADVLDLCGLSAIHAGRYPHEMSGGQRQRVVIARAISTSPDFIVADEPVSALDVSTRAQIINLIRKLQSTLGLTTLFISHDVAVVAHTCQRIAVMYLGRVVELASREALLANPLHPYTRALLSAVPIPDPAREALRARTILLGDPPDPARMPAGCSFHPRCPLATERCRQEAPLLQWRTGGQFVACHHAPEGAAAGALNAPAG
jgi:oligopeptide/dipeptide ABC transporter ATP-binding protein